MPISKEGLVLNGKLKALILTITIAWAGWVSLSIIDAINFHGVVLSFMDEGSRFTPEDYIREEVRLRSELRQEYIPREGLNERLKRLEMKLDDLHEEITSLRSEIRTQK